MAVTQERSSGSDDPAGTASGDTAGDTHHQRYGVQVFSAESGAPRDRRSADGFVVGSAALLLAGLAIVADDRFEIDDRWSQLVRSAPDWVGALAGLLYFLAGLYLLLLVVGVAFVAHKRKDILRDILVATVLALAAMFALSFWVSGRAPEFSFLTTDLETRTFPAGWLTLMTAVHATASPQLSRPLRQLGWTVVLGVAVTGMLADITTPRATLGGLLVGLIVAGVTLLVFGSPKARPTLSRVAAALDDLGVDAHDLAYADPQWTRATLVEATTSDDTEIHAVVGGRDAEQTRYVSEAWRAAWYHDQPWPRTTRLGRVEHAALAALIANAVGVNTPAVLAVGEGGAQDAVLVTAVSGRRFDQLDESEVTDDILDRLWNLLASVHGTGIAHGRFNSTRLTLDAAGVVSVTDFSDARLSATPARQRQDVAELLVSTALIVGPDRAVSAMFRQLGADETATIVGFLQSAALTPALRLRVRTHRLSIRKLRSQVAAAAGVDEVEPEPLHRTSVKQVLMLASAVLAVYLLMSLFADVGLEATLDALAGAVIPLALATLVVTQTAEIANAVVVLGSSPKPLPFGIVTIQQFSINYINLIVPSSAGRVAVNVRFAQKMGIPTVNALTLGALASLSGFAVQAFWLIVLVLGGDWSVDWSQVSFSGTVVKLLAVAVVAAVLFLLVALAVRRLRNWLKSKTRNPIRQLRGNLSGLRSPSRLVKLFGGNAINQLLLAAGLLLSTLAVGSHITLVEALFINTIVSLFAGLMPIPGGVGITEAGLSAGLVAVGVPSDLAFAAVVIFRLCTFYLPPIWGGIAMRWLTRNDYL